MSVKLMKAKAWAQREFEAESLPCSITLKKWVESGYISGRVIGGTTYVFADQKAGLDTEVSHAVSELLRG